MNYKLLVAYDGTNYFGWQKTPTGPSIEGELERVLEQILQQKVVLQAASRTDRGVHALGQVVNFHCEEKQIVPKKLLIGINALLPPDIAVMDIEEVNEDFHATLKVVSKEYQYSICFGAVQLPQYRHYSWHYHYPLDIVAMEKAAAEIKGTHDFAAFTNQKKNETYDHHLRTVDEIRIEAEGKDRLKLYVTGHSFLYKMVRNIVGTLAYVGVGKITPHEVGEILSQKNRILAGVTAPAHGLTLSKIHY